MTDASSSAVDGYFEGQLIAPDPVLEAALAASTAAGLPAIQVSASQGKFLELMALARGALIVVDNVVRGGAVASAERDAPAEGIRRIAAWVASEPHLSARVIQTVGSKGYDGLLLARVEGPA